MKNSEFLEIMQTLAPAETALDYDNVGFLVDLNEDIKKIIIGLDLTPDLIEQAIACGANLIVTHHPIMFDKLNKIQKDDYEGFLIIELIKNGISFFAAHTNMDIAENGINDTLAKQLELNDVESFSQNGIGRVGKLTNTISREQLAKYIKQKLNSDFVRVSGKNDRISKVAIVGGSGGSAIDDAIETGAQAFITGEVKYHNHLRAEFDMLSIFECGHFETEKNFVNSMFESLQSKLNVLKCNVNVVKEDIHSTYIYY